LLKIIVKNKIKISQSTLLIIEKHFTLLKSCNKSRLFSKLYLKSYFKFIKKHDCQDQHCFKIIQYIDHSNEQSGTNCIFVNETHNFYRSAIRFFDRLWNSPNCSRRKGKESEEENMKDEKVSRQTCWCSNRVTIFVWRG